MWEKSSSLAGPGGGPEHLPLAQAVGRSALGGGPAAGTLPGDSSGVRGPAWWGSWAVSPSHVSCSVLPPRGSVRHASSGSYQVTASEVLAAEQGAAGRGCGARCHQHCPSIPPGHPAPPPGGWEGPAGQGEQNHSLPPPATCWPRLPRSYCRAAGNCEHYRSVKENKRKI